MINCDTLINNSYCSAHMIIIIIHNTSKNDNGKR